MSRLPASRATVLPCRPTRPSIRLRIIRIRLIREFVMARINRAAQKEYR